MAKVSLKLDTRSSSKNKITGKFPVVFVLSHRGVCKLRMDLWTTKNGWDNVKSALRKSIYANSTLNCDLENSKLNEKIYSAQRLLNKLGRSISRVTRTQLLELIKKEWDDQNDSNLRKKIDNDISLIEWGNVLIKRKLVSDKPGSAKWMENCIAAVIKYNNGRDLKLYDITVSFLKDFEAYHFGKGNSANTISIRVRCLKTIYNCAINEDQFTPIRNPFKIYKTPKLQRTKKRAIRKEKFLSIRDLDYEFDSALWHAKNYALIMFYCRGMNFVDLVQLKLKNLAEDRLYYGRSKTGEPLSIKIMPELAEILNSYTAEKQQDDYLFPTNYDGTTKHFEKYKTQRRRMNERLKLIAIDAGINEQITTYTIRHTWATTAKYLGISAALISEGLGHSSIRTTEAYLKDFENAALDEMNAIVTSF